MSQWLKVFQNKRNKQLLITLKKKKLKKVLKGKVPKSIKIKVEDVEFV